MITMKLQLILNKYRYKKRFPNSNIIPISSISNIGKIEIGEYTYGHFDVLCWSSDDSVQIGKFCSIAPYVKILGGGEHNKNLVSTYPLKHFFMNNKLDPNVKTKGPTIIGNDVWIGINSLILSGVKISDGAIIGAGSVVAKDIPPYAIAIGNPIKIIGYRFEEDIIRKLISISWWNWPIEKIKENIEYFYNNVEDFIERFYKEI